MTGDPLSADLQDDLATLILVILSSSISTVHATVTEIVTEAATAEIEAAAVAIAAALVLGGTLMWARGRARASISVAAGFLLALIALAVAVRTDGWLLGIDLPVTNWFVDHRTSALDQVATAITTAGGPPEIAALGLVIAALMIWRTKRYAPALILLGTVALATIICTALKMSIGRERPPIAIQLMLETDPSFPSGHVTGTATLLMMSAIVISTRKSKTVRTVLICAALAIAVVVGATRLYLGVHWLTDVCAGMLVAALCVLLGAQTLHRADTRAAHDSADPTQTEKAITV